MTTPDRQHPFTPDTETERAAGELLAALSESAAADTVLPASLAARLVAQGEAAVRAQATGAAAAAADAADASRQTPAPLRALPAAPAPRRALAPWMLAIAATLAWLVLPSPLRREAQAPSPRSAVAALHDSLAASAGVQRVAWAASTDPAGRAARGEVLWDAAAQRGVMRFEGLVPNDPRVAQYQLWIVDAERDARYPVDGGVFDVTSSGEVLVPISARLPVGRATLFAVTLEVPGGVVVSSRERLVLAAPVEG